jgi:uncharacterized protein (UPF0297 family)
MVTAYLDHNLVHYFAIGFPSAELDRQERAALEQLREIADLHFVFSDWSIIEAASYRNPAQAGACGAFIESLDPLWIFEANRIQKQEIRNFIAEQYEAAPSRPVNVLNAHISQLLSGDPQISAVPLGTTPEGWIRYYQRHPDALLLVRTAIARTPDALRIGQRARAEGIINEYAPIIDRAYLGGLMPVRDSRNNLASAAQREHWLERCCADVTALLRTCPAVAVEDALTTFRTLNADRNPRESDAIVLQHAIGPLAYCDYFVSGDAYLCEGARYAAAQTRAGAVVCRTIVAAAQSIAA